MGSVAVIGGGPAGMTAAGFAAENGASVILLERNDRLGKKLNITGKGRCNVTNAADKDGLLSAIMSNARFMQSAFSMLGSAETIAFFEKNGVKLKTERGRRVFPESNRANDITKALEGFTQKNGVKVLRGQRVLSVDLSSGSFFIRTGSASFTADTVIIATGGLSYPSTGCDGDGYKLARALGHTVTPTYPSLVPLIVSEPWISEVEGLSLKNVRCSVFTGNKKPVYSETGEMMFTASGVTGPLILTASRYITDKLPLKTEAPPPVVSIDLKPALDEATINERVRRDFSENINRDFANALAHFSRS